jgi:hypothetical protein
MDFWLWFRIRVSTFCGWFCAVHPYLIPVPPFLHFSHVTWSYLPFPISFLFPISGLIGVGRLQGQSAPFAGQKLCYSNMSKFSFDSADSCNVRKSGLVFCPMSSSGSKRAFAM